MYFFVDEQQISVIRNVLQTSKKLFEHNKKLDTQFSILIMLFESVNGKLELSRNIAKTMYEKR